MLITTQLRACCWSLFVNGSTHLTLLYVDHYTTDSLLLATFCQRLHTSDITYVDHYTTDSLLLVMFCWQLHTSDIALCLSLHNREPAVSHFLSMASHIWHCFMLITTQPQPAVGHVLLITTQQLVIWFPFVFQHLQRKFKIPLLWDPYQARFPP